MSHLMKWLEKHCFLYWHISYWNIILRHFPCTGKHCKFHICIWAWSTFWCTVAYKWPQSWQSWIKAAKHQFWFHGDISKMCQFWEVIVCRILRKDCDCEWNEKSNIFSLLLFFSHMTCWHEIFDAHLGIYLANVFQ